MVYNQESYYDAIKNVLPEDKEIWDDQLLGELKSFSDLLVEKICIANYKRKVDFKFSALMKKKIDDVKKAKSKESERIINSKKRVEQKLRFLYNKELERMRKKSEMQKANEEFVKTYDDSKYPKPSVTADIVIFGMFDKEEDNYRKIAEKELKVLLIQRGAAPYEGCYALPGGFVGPKETIGEAAERELKEETNCNCNFLEQFGTYSNPDRDPRRWVISNGYMALVNAGQEIIQAGDDASDAKWFDVSFQEEAGIWNLCLTHGDEKLHARLEETTSKWDVKKKFKTIESDDLAFDHELILADAIVQLRKWITETHIAFRLLPEKFTLRELQQIHETVLDTKLLVPAFRRKVADLVEDTGEMTGDAGHRPAKLYREKR